MRAGGKGLLNLAGGSVNEPLTESSRAWTRKPVRPRASLGARVKQAPAHRTTVRAAAPTIRSPILWDMDAYGLGLLAALMGLGAGAALALWSRGASGLARALLWLGLGLGAAVLGWHLATGHAPGTDSALSPLGFVAEHPAAFLALLVGVCLALWLRWINSGRQGRETGDR